MRGGYNALKNNRSEERVRQLAEELLNYWEEYNNEEYLVFIKSYKDRENLLNFICKEIQHNDLNTIYDVLNDNVKNCNKNEANKKGRGLKLMKKLNNFYSR